MPESLPCATPRRFTDLVEHRHVGGGPAPGAAAHTPPQHILSSGSSGLGKTTTARIFAAALQCTVPGPTSTRAWACAECVDIGEGGHPDVIELNAAS